MTKEERCPNYETNVQQCPCPETDCEHHGICCACVAAHASDGSATACMSGVSRPDETRKLPIGANPDCSNRAHNVENCSCYETSCSRRGLCCDCIRYHWGHKVWPTVACMS